ncbi:Rieske (2Fe-2S) iron-sulfur domain protein [Isosphaera pallida ATCC 43644]|uniref:Rieske (2Fe-2S) iron-sulfur domain protein n=1 Tax=Isosphaera pallida (strain ATCC 43644 / DSM 9630 / IS1B) TaxID=575540 RepID=E8QYZ2_ISOPI|nr:Rieske (2Fe-2S) iron-sulfur domain protein [Isosphaera pallida ATCC 43644]
MGLEATNHTLHHREGWRPTSVVWANLKEGDVTRLEPVAGWTVALVRHGDQPVILSDRCPHAGGSLGRGWVEDGELVCPLHRWRFRLPDGGCSNIPGERVERFNAQVRAGRVWVRLPPDLEAGPLDSTTLPEETDPRP